MPRKPCGQKSPKTKRVRFDFHALDPQRVSLVGEFNGWDVNARPMKKDKEGNWRTTLNLAPGRYEYRFYVDDTWQDDPKAQERVANPFGDQNCVKIVG